MAYIELDIENLEDTRQKVREVFLTQNKNITAIQNRVEVHPGKARKTRKLFAVDSGFNSAYESPFVVFKAAVVDEEMNVDQLSRAYLFHVDNYQNDRLRRLLMQQIMYEALSKTVETGVADKAIMLVDGTITLSVFYPTTRDGKEYRNHFKRFYEKLYAPLLDQCLKSDTVLLGFLKRTGSTFLARQLDLQGVYDRYIINTVLKESQYVPAIPIVDAHATAMPHSYVTFYLNLKGWNYRFELLNQQEDLCKEVVENLLYWTTNAHFGMNPIFSKADEYARVAKKEANLKFNYIIQSLSEKERVTLRLEARRQTHFGYRAGRHTFEKGIRR